MPEKRKKRSFGVQGCSHHDNIQFGKIHYERIHFGKYTLNHPPSRIYKLKLSLFVLPIWGLQIIPESRLTTHSVHHRRENEIRDDNYHDKHEDKGKYKMPWKGAGKNNLKKVLSMFLLKLVK